MGHTVARSRAPAAVAPVRSIETPKVKPMKRSLRQFRKRKAMSRPLVHFHKGPQGRPVPCDDARCSRPQLEIDGRSQY